MSEADERPWGDRLREMLKVTFSQRLDPLASELNSLQSTFDAACAHLISQARSSNESDVDAVAEEILKRFKATEDEFTSTLVSLRGELEAASRADRAKLNAAIAEIDRQRTQAGVLGATVLGASGFASRVALFIVRGGRVVGWRGVGFGGDSHGSAVTLLSTSVAERNLLTDALDRRLSLSVTGKSEPGYLTFLGSHRVASTTNCVAVPLVVRDKAAAVLFADTSASVGLDVQPLEALMRVASMAIELLPLRRSTESFTSELPPPRILTAALEASVAQVSAQTEATQPAPQPVEPEPVRELPEPPPSPAVQEPLQLRETIDLKSLTNRDNDLAPSGEVNGHPRVTAPVESTGSVDAASASESAALVDTPASTDPRAHLNARRFARFLIGEIKLYQPSRVAEGCRRADLYDRLRDELEMSRKLFERHVPAQVTAEFDYFYHELVNSLAEGDATKLGRNFPMAQS